MVRWTTLERLGVASDEMMPLRSRPEALYHSRHEEALSIKGPGRFPCRLGSPTWPPHPGGAGSSTRRAETAHLSRQRRTATRDRPHFKSLDARRCRRRRAPSLQALREGTLRQAPPGERPSDARAAWGWEACAIKVRGLFPRGCGRRDTSAGAYGQTPSWLPDRVRASWAHYALRGEGFVPSGVRGLHPNWRGCTQIRRSPS